VARHVAVLTVRAEGRLARVHLELAPRSDAPTRRQAALDFDVLMRGSEEDR
jgi:hypothetical protein